MKKGIIILLLGCISSGVLAQTSANSQQEKFITHLLSQQVKQQNSIKSSVSSILTRYPEKVSEVIAAALKLYPDEYKQIMQGALDAEPVLACGVVDIFIQADVAPRDEIVNLAVEAEPAYAQEILYTATITSYEVSLQNAELNIPERPFNPKDLMSSAMESHPKSKLDILKGTIMALPSQVAQFVKEALLLFPDDNHQIIETAISTSDQQYKQSIVETAMNLGINRQLVNDAAIQSSKAQVTFD